VSENPRVHPSATISVDVDTIDAHLAGYGVEAAPADSAVYARALPRILTLLAEADVRATFFWIARDAERVAGLLREAVAAGHEIASHTATHPAAWRQLPPSDVARELRESKGRLEQASGAHVVGFRSPGWHGPACLPDALLEAGYRYDASSFPSPLLGVAAAALWLRSRARRRTALGVRSWFAPRAPSSLRASELREFPVSVTRTLRFPIYHTLRYGFGDARFARALDRLAREGHELSYPLHAVDALGLAEDGLDVRIAPHPGMGVPLDAKLALLRRTLHAIAERYATATFASRIGAAPRATQARAEALSRGSHASAPAA